MGLPCGRRIIVPDIFLTPIPSMRCPANVRFVSICPVSHRNDGMMYGSSEKACAGQNGKVSGKNHREDF